MSSSFPDLLSAVTRAKTLRQLKQLHAKALHHAFHGRLNHWVAVLLAHCARLRASPSYARSLFYSVPRPNAHAFTSMLKYCCRLGAHRDCLALLSRMRDMGVPADAFVFPFLFKGCSGGSVASMHAHVMKLGHGSDEYVRNAVMDAYARQGKMEVSRKVFDEISETTVVDWNTMVSGYWKWGQQAEACLMFDAMPERNIISWTAMVSGYSKVGELEKARETFDSMPQRSVVSWNAMLSGYVQNGSAEEALTLFAEMMHSGMRPDETTWVTIVSACSSKGDLALAESLVGSLDERGTELNCFVRTALVDMYAKCGDLARARQIFDEMGIRNSVSWNAMISGYARVGNLGAARELFDRMPERNVVSWNSMISGYVQNGQWVPAIELFKSMSSTAKDVTADEVTMVSIISACGHLGALETGRWVVDFASRNRIELGVSGYNALVFMYSRCGCMGDAKRVFKGMPSRDLISYNSLITGFATHGCGVEALQLLREMREEGVEPDRITFIGVLTACSHAGLTEEGQEVFRAIEKPTVDHYACMVDLLGRAGRLDAAKELIDGMPMEPHAGVYGALLNASRVHRRHDLGQLAAGKLFVLEPENAGNYVLLANIYASAGRWADVETVRKTMRERGVEKVTGYSWVELAGRVHRFTAGDQFHPRMKDIHRVLEEYGRKMRELGYAADKSWSLRDVEEEEKEEMMGTHSEKLAIGFALLVTEPGAVVRVVKNLRICGDCHAAIKLISQLSGRELVIRDNNRFHCFAHGECSCQDFW